jgi:putative ABC transport system permease protein
MSRQPGRRSLPWFVLAQLRARRGRAGALGAGILVAAVCFGLLSSETATSKLQVTTKVKQNFRSAYDILVRPRAAQTPFEREHHVVDAGFLSGLFGGITLREYDEINAISGVSLAAPIANVGYVMMTEDEYVPFPRSISRTSSEVFRVSTHWNVHDGLANVPGKTFYLYWTDGRLRFTSPGSGYGLQRVPGHRRPLEVCDGFVDGEHPAHYAVIHGTRVPVVTLSGAPKDPYTASLTPFLNCSGPHVTVTKDASEFFSGALGETAGKGRFGAVVSFTIPVLVAGIDPAAENTLVGLKHAMVSGHYLGEGQGLTRPTKVINGPGYQRDFPLIASDRTYLDETADLTIQRLDTPHGRQLEQLLASPRAYRALIDAHGTVVGHTSDSPTDGWRAELAHGFTRESSPFSDVYYRISPTRDSVTPTGSIIAHPVRNDPDAWTTNLQSYTPDTSLAPPGAADTSYRSLTPHAATGDIRTIDGRTTFLVPDPTLVGTFDPTRLRGFSPLSRVPLQTFFPPTLTAADPAARRSLGSRALGPTMNLSGYLSQPPLLLTTIQGAIAMENGDGESYEQSVPTTARTGPHAPHELRRAEAYEGVSPSAPISVIQVRVKGVTGPNQLSLARIKLVAEKIVRMTGLTVNITAGSSPTPETIRLAAGKFGEPPLTVHQGWVREDVDSGITDALSNEDLALSLLVLVVCGLFVASATAASVRQRRREIAILSTLGWNARSIFTLVIGESALVGFIAGLLGCALSIALAAAGSLQIPDGRLALVVPVTVALAATAAAGPAWRAAHVPPMDALRDPVTAGGRSHRVRTPTGMALANLLRVPGRTLLAIVTLAIGVGALALIVGVTLAFRGGVAGTLLGSVVSVSVRSVDLISCCLVVLVGAAGVTDVMVVSLRERAAELATLRALGWTERQIQALAARESLTLGIVGSLVGAAVGLAVVAILGASTGSVLLAAAVAVLGGVIVTTAALALPLARLSKATLVAALAGE